MLELTDHQLLTLSQLADTPLHIVNPLTKETFVLLRVEEYERLTAEDYDDSPWTQEELEAQASLIAEQSDWDEYDDPAEQP